MNPQDVANTPQKTSKTGDPAGFLKVPTDTSTQSFTVEAQIANADIMDGTVATQKLNTTGDAAGFLKIPTDTSTGQFTVASSVDGTEFADNSVTTAKLQDAAVTTDKLADSSVTAAKIASETITANQIANFTLTNTKIAEGTLTANNCSFTRRSMTGFDPDGFSNAGIVVVNRNDSTFSKAWTLSGGCLADNSVTAAKLDTTISNVISSMPALEFGQSNTLSISAGSHTTVDITFAATKTEAPLLFATLQTASADATVSVTVQSVTNQQASIIVANTGTADITDGTLDWLAISGR